MGAWGGVVCGRGGAGFRRARMPERCLPELASARSEVPCSVVTRNTWQARKEARRERQPQVKPVCAAAPAQPPATGPRPALSSPSQLNGPTPHTPMPHESDAKLHAFSWWSCVQRSSPRRAHSQRRRGETAAHGVRRHARAAAGAPQCRDARGIQMARYAFYNVQRSQPRGRHRAGRLVWSKRSTLAATRVW